MQRHQSFVMARFGAIVQYVIDVQCSIGAPLVPGIIDESLEAPSLSRLLRSFSSLLQSGVNSGSRQQLRLRARPPSWRLEPLAQALSGCSCDPIRKERCLSVAIAEQVQRIGPSHRGALGERGARDVDEEDGIVAGVAVGGVGQGVRGGRGEQGGPLVCDCVRLFPCVYLSLHILVMRVVMA